MGFSSVSPLQDLRRVWVLNTSVTLVGISSFLTHLCSSLLSSDFTCCGIPLHLLSSIMNVMAVSLGEGKMHCLGDSRSATYSPLKFPQSPVTLFLKSIGVDRTSNLSPSASMRTPYFLDLIVITPSMYLVTTVSKCSNVATSSFGCPSILTTMLLPRENLDSLDNSTSNLCPSTIILTYCFWGVFLVETKILGLVDSSEKTTCSQSFKGYV